MATSDNYPTQQEKHIVIRHRLADFEALESSFWNVDPQEASAYVHQDDWQQ